MYQVRYLENKDTNKKLKLEVKDTKELRGGLLHLLKKSVKDGIEISVKLSDVALVGYKGDAELAELYTRSVLRGHHAKGIYKSFLLRQGKRGSYNDCYREDSFGGLGVHMDIFSLCVQMAYFKIISHEDIINAIRETC